VHEDVRERRERAYEKVEPEVAGAERAAERRAKDDRERGRRDLAEHEIEGVPGDCAARALRGRLRGGVRRSCQGLVFGHRTRSRNTKSGGAWRRGFSRNELRA